MFLLFLCRMSDSDKDSIESINAYDTDSNMNVTAENSEDTERLGAVRQSIRNWKVREMDKNTSNTSNAKGLQSLRKYVANSARLYYDLNNYLNTEKNDEKNMQDSMYVGIVSSIGVPGGLSFHLKTLLQHILQRDLLELPFTLEPKLINTYAGKGIRAPTQFPDEE